MPTKEQVAATAALVASFEALTSSLAARAVGRLKIAFKAWLDGTLTTGEFEAVAADMLKVDVHGAYKAGSGWASMTLDKPAVGHIVPTEEKLAALDNAMHTLVFEEEVLDQPEDDDPDAGESSIVWDDDDTDTVSTETEVVLPPRMERLVASEVVDAVQQSTVRAYDFDEAVVGYRRGTDSDPCELCVWLVKAHLDPAGIGYVYPTGKSFHRHPGCQCAPIPVFNQEGEAND